MPKAKNLPPVVAAFGRFNPPTKGHEKLFAVAIDSAKRLNGIPMVFLSSTQDTKKNPLSWSQKFKYINLLMPQFSWIVSKEETGNPYQTIDFLAEQGFTEVYFVAGEDREEDYNKLAAYAKKEHGIKVDVISAGKRSEKTSMASIQGISASKVREAAVQGKLRTVMLGLSDQSGKQKESIARNLIQDIRKGLGLKKLELTEFNYLDIGHRHMGEDYYWFLDGKTKKIIIKQTRDGVWIEDGNNHLSDPDYNPLATSTSGRVEPSSKRISIASRIGDFFLLRKTVRACMAALSKQFPGYQYVFFFHSFPSIHTEQDLFESVEPARNQLVEYDVSYIKKPDSYLNYGHPAPGPNVVEHFWWYDRLFQKLHVLSNPYTSSTDSSGHHLIPNKSWTNSAFAGRIDHDKKAITVVLTDEDLPEKTQVFLLNKTIFPRLSKAFPGYKFKLGDHVSYLNEAIKVSHMSSGEGYMDYGQYTPDAIIWWYDGATKKVGIRPLLTDHERDLGHQLLDDSKNTILFSGRVDRGKKAISVDLHIRSSFKEIPSEEQTATLRKYVFPELAKAFPNYEFKLTPRTAFNLAEWDIKTMSAGETYYSYGHSTQREIGVTDIWWFDKNRNIQVQTVATDKYDAGHNQIFSDSDWQDISFYGRIDTDKKTISVEYNPVCRQKLSDHSQSYLLHKHIFPKLSSKYPNYKFRLTKNVTYAPMLESQLRTTQILMESMGR